MNVFERGALAAGVAVDRANFRILSFDAGLKYKGIFLQTEIITAGSTTSRRMERCR